MVSVRVSPQSGHVGTPWLRNGSSDEGVSSMFPAWTLLVGVARVLGHTADPDGICVIATEWLSDTGIMATYD